MQDVNNWKKKFTTIRSTSLVSYHVCTDILLSPIRFQLNKKCHQTVQLCVKLVFLVFKINQRRDG
jgi:hypothetical protein